MALAEHTSNSLFLLNMLNLGVTIRYKPDVIVLSAEQPLCIFLKRLGEGNCVHMFFFYVFLGLSEILLSVYNILVFNYILTFLCRPPHIKERCVQLWCGTTGDDDRTAINGQEPAQWRAQPG